MVFVGVGTDHMVQSIHTLGFQIGHHQTAVGHVAAVDEHGLAPAEQQGGVCLTHVDKVDGQC